MKRFETIYSKKKVPQKFLSQVTCFRKESGSAFNFIKVCCVKSLQGI